MSIYPVHAKFSKSLQFILFCIKNLCSANVKKNFFLCGAVVLLAKVALVVQPMILGLIVDDLEKVFKNGYLIILSISAFCGIGLFSAVMLSIKNYFILLLREQISKDFSLELLRKLHTFSHHFFYNENVSKISEINNRGQEALHGFMTAFLSDIIPFFLEVLLVFVVVVAKFNLIISVHLIAVFILYVLIGMYFSPKERKFGALITQAKIETAHHFCIFQPKSISDSNLIRSRIPLQIDR